MTANIVDFRIKLGATRPNLKAVLQDSLGNRIDLNTGVVAVSLQMRIVDGPESINGPCDILGDEGPGVVEYVWADGAPSLVGFYKAQFWVEYQDGSEEPFPGEGYLTIEITNPLSEVL
jgi:hypothetical protein